MHPELKRIFDLSIEALKADPRVIAGLNFGSAGREHEDELSDVDPAFFVRDDDFDSLDRDLRSIFESVCPPIVLWWPEVGNNDRIRNYAIFFQSAGALLQYDVNIIKASEVSGNSGRWIIGQSRPEDILFDKAGILEEAVRNTVLPPYSPERLLWHIERFWIYAYIHVKYLKRAHKLKLAFAQEMLRNAHLEILRALYPDVWWGWWPDAAKRFYSSEHEEALLWYFGHADAGSVAGKLPRQMDAFSRDARAACERCGLDYPAEFEQHVRRHFEQHTALD
jgi:hypothetical protein